MSELDLLKRLKPHPNVIQFLGCVTKDVVRHKGQKDFSKFACVKRDFRFRKRQFGPVIRALALRFGDPGFKTRSDHSLNMIPIVPGSTSQLHL